ncbi:hypothetical protein SBV1_2430012 [Verrucomicrobia bacterium]|nr:hypothetical protein SBV1_2430012 [Verrucomicrobiota bacterium]
MEVKGRAREGAALFVCAPFLNQPGRGTKIGSRSLRVIAHSNAHRSRLQFHWACPPAPLRTLRAKGFALPWSGRGPVNGRDALRILIQTVQKRTSTPEHQLCLRQNSTPFFRARKIRLPFNPRQHASFFIMSPRKLSSRVNTP